MRYHRPLNSAGVTIVEVLIVLAVLSLAFSISASTASRGLTQSQNAQEHSQGLGFLDTQIEFLRIAVAANANVFQSATFCMTSGTAVNNNFGPSFDPNASAAGDDFTQYPAACTYVRGGVTYYTSVRYFCNASCAAAGSVNSYFEFRIRWDGQGNLGRQQENIVYKILPLSTDLSSGIQVSILAPLLRDGRI